MSNQFRIPKNDWEDPRSFIVPKTGAKRGYEGTLYHNNAEFSFTLSKQANGKYLYRGRVSALDADGKILKITEAQKKASKCARDKQKKTDGSLTENSQDASANLPEPSGNDAPKAEQSPAVQKEYPISGECYCNQTDEESIKKAVLDKVLDMYVEYQPQILRVLRESTRPSEITPAVAALLYVNRFFDLNYKDASEETVVRYRRSLQKHFAQLPNIPMTDFRPSMITRYFKENVVGRHTCKLMKQFWQFLLLRGYCTGTEDPFPVEEKRKISPQARQKESLRKDTLSLEEQDKLFESIMSKDAVTGGDCGIALNLWGGFHLDDGLTWQDVLFDGQDAYLVRIDYHRKDAAGATHDFTRPIFPQAAIILRRRYSQLRLEYGARELAKYPIISQEKSPEKAMSADALRGYIGLVLRRIGVTEATFAALKDEKIAVSKLLLANSYEHNVTQRAGFQDRYGVANFLQGQSLRGSVTEDHYLSHTDSDAIDFMHTGQMAMQPLRALEQDDAPHATANGDTEYVFSPENTRQALGVIGELILFPGEGADFLQSHGARGTLRMRGVNEDGKVKRKSRKQAKGAKTENTEKRNGVAVQSAKLTCSESKPTSPTATASEESGVQERSALERNKSPNTSPKEKAKEPFAQAKQRGPKKEKTISGQESLF